MYYIKRHEGEDSHFWTICNDKTQAVRRLSLVEVAELYYRYPRLLAHPTFSCFQKEDFPWLSGKP